MTADIDALAAKVLAAVDSWGFAQPGLRLAADRAHVEAYRTLWHSAEAGMGRHDI